MTKFLTPVMATIFAIAFFSCNNSGNGNETTKPTDTTAAVAQAPALPPAFTPFNLLIVKHKVADFDKWKVGYMAHDSMRRASGIMHAHMGRGMEDSNMVVVFDSVSDIQKAKDFGASAGLKEAMKKAGVVGPPSISLVNVVRSETPPADMNDRILISHKVKDFATWLKAYDAEGDSTREANGLKDRLLARGIEDSSIVYIVFIVTDMAKAKARFNSPELKKIMTDAGVISKPEAFMYKLVD
jgi:hypothetical protein